MKIETKYSMRDAAFVMHNNRAVSIKIMGVYYSLDVYKGEHITYASDIVVAGGPIRFWEAARKPVIQMDLEGNFIKEWDSAIAAGKTLRLSQGNISSCCLGKRNKCGNFKWKYKNEN